MFQKNIFMLNRIYLSKKISVLENAGSTKAAALMQMIIEEIQLRQANYRYTVSTLAFNLVLFF